MRVGILGGSGYAGGELLRLLTRHPNADITFISSRRFAGEYVHMIHPNLRGVTNMKFTPIRLSEVSELCDLVFLATPHGASKDMVPSLLDKGVKVIDLSADFRLKNPLDYQKYYGWEHPYPDLLEKAVFGLPELYKEDLPEADIVACPGCMAGATILALAPIIKAGLIEENKIVVDTKIGSSGGGSTPTLASHHPERFGAIRPYQTVGHRHTAEIEQELNKVSTNNIKVAFSPHSVNSARGILVTCHTWLKTEVKDRDLWKAFRSFYNKATFIRIVKYKKGLYQLPDPKVLIGTNYCDIGFEIDTHVNRLVILSAIDNIVKGAAGQGVQCFNIMQGLDEITGLDLVGFH
jgi:N-acetyl-gamma-glutamyl-phosphate/LysW-gamma-L-alpha-aminoadipyl-6-phosphate reductase